MSRLYIRQKPEQGAMGTKYFIMLMFIILIRAAAQMAGFMSQSVLILAINSILDTRSRDDWD